jgi:hypothetical protein
MLQKIRHEKTATRRAAELAEGNLTKGGFYF